MSIFGKEALLEQGHLLELQVVFSSLSYRDGIFLDLEADDYVMNTYFVFCICLAIIQCFFTEL